MPKFLVHVTHGPEAPTRAALAFLVAGRAAGLTGASPSDPRSTGCTISR